MIHVFKGIYSYFVAFAKVVIKGYICVIGFNIKNSSVGIPQDSIISLTDGFRLKSNLNYGLTI